jgi:hypothetical protein
MPNRSSGIEDVQAISLPVFSGNGKAVSHVSLLSSGPELRSITSELEDLRLRSSFPNTLVSMPGWFEAHRSPAGWAHRVLLLRTGDRVDAAVFLLERVVFGLPTGYFHGGDALGDTLILCAEQ